MAELRPYTSLQAVLVPSLILDDSVAATSQAGPVPGTPEAATTNAGDGVLVSTGTQDTTTREVYAVRAGQPGYRGAEVLWRESGDSADEWRGHDPPNVVRETEGMWDDLVAGHVLYAWDAVRTSNGTLIAVLDDYDALPQDTYRPASWTPTGGWTEHAAILSQRRYAGGQHCLFADDAGYAYMVQLRSAGVLTSDRQVDVRRCHEDAPATWTLYSRDALASADTRAPSVMRAVWVRGRVCLVMAYASGGTPYLVQYASDDGGATFREVEDWSGTEAAYLPDLAALPDGRIVLVYVRRDAGNESVCLRVIGDPGEGFLSGTRQTVSTSYATECSCALTEDGERLVIVHDHGSSYYGQLAVKFLDTDDLTDDGVHSWLSGLAAGSTTVEWDGLVVRYAGGQLHGFAHLNRTDVAADCTWLTTFRAGGWRDRVMPRWYLASDDVGRASWGRAIPLGAGAPSIDSALLVAAADGAGKNLHPENRGWTLVNTSADRDATVGAWEWDFTGGAGQGRYYQDATGTVDGGIIVGWECRVPAGGDVTASHVVVEVTLADGATERRITVRFGPLGIRIYDQIAGADVDSVAWDSTAWGTFLLAVSSTTVTLWAWTLGGTLHTATITGAISSTNVAPAAQPRVMWGQPALSTAHSQWRWIGYVAGDAAAEIGPALVGQGTPLATYSDADLPGRTLPASGAAWLDDGLYLRGTSGPAFLADTWTLAPAYQYPAASLLPRVESCPRRGWRSTSHGTPQTLTWTLTEPERIGPSVGIVLLRPNFSTAYWEGDTTGVGGWVTLATLDLRVASSLGYVRSGRQLRPALLAPGSTRYIARDELVGGYAVMAAGATVRRITSNTEGVWGTVAGRKTPIITIETTGGEPASGADLAIIGPCYGAVLHEQDTAHYAYRLRVPSTTTLEGYHALGQLVVGPLAVLGFLTDEETSSTLTSGATVTTLPSRVSAVRVDGPPARAVQVTPQTCDISILRGSAPTPDYLTGSDAGLPVATYRDGILLLEGLLDEADGAAVPVAWLPRVPRGAGLLPLRGREDVLYGMMTSGVARRVVQGDWNTSEVLGADSIVIEELV